MDEQTPITQEQFENVVAALRTCATELLTLAPRLSGRFQSNANACVAIAKDALAQAGRKL